MAEIWAKGFKRGSEQNQSHIRLSEHIFDILCAFKKLKSKINDDNLKKAIEFGIIFHDLGKVIPKFQINTLGNKKYEPYDIIHEIPHSLFSVFWINSAKVKESLQDEDLLKFVNSAVAYHHWRENFAEIISRSFELKKFSEWAKQTIEDLKNNICQEIGELKNKIGGTTNLLSFSGDLNDLISRRADIEETLQEIINGVRFYEFAVPPYVLDFEAIRQILIKSQEDHKKWILISGFLQRCDHFASWCEAEDENLDKIEIEPTNFSDVRDSIVSGLKISEDKIWQISKSQSYRDKDLILIAPTGYGKTEFAFLWSADKKFIYTLPLRSAVNQIYERAQRIFGNYKVGILHSDADVYILEKEIETGIVERDIGDNFKLYDLSRNLSFQVIVSTGDQFFPYALKPPGYEKIFSLFSYANLVVDEVQAYDPKACAIIVQFAKWVKIMGGKFLLMTATLPEFVREKVRELFENSIEELNIYEDKKDEFSQIVKHKIKIELVDNQDKNKFDIPDEILQRALDLAGRGKRVLFILNTVRQAQEVYKKLMDKATNNLKEKIYLIHSRFTLEDRRKKEINLIENEFRNPKPDNENEGKILVATQVVEASLNIDADVLFTEICPLDALVQRMGRVLRRIGPNFEFEGENDGVRTYKDTLNRDREYKVDLSEPNVYLIIFKNGLESGNGMVYHKELIRLSIAWLWEHLREDIVNLDFNEDNRDQFFKENFSEIALPQSENVISKKGRSKKKQKQGKEAISIIQIITKNDDWIRSIEIQDFSISEYEKYKIVELFYKSLDKNGEYLSEFYKTLEVLEAGYMSDRKEEAQNIFRKVYDVNIIPQNKLDDFVNKLREFFETHKGHRRYLYSEFKAEILSKFLLSVPYSRYMKELIPVWDQIESEIEDKIDENLKRRVKAWLSDVYIGKLNYDEELGISFDKEPGSWVNERII